MPNLARAARVSIVALLTWIPVADAALPPPPAASVPTAEDSARTSLADALDQEIARVEAYASTLERRTVDMRAAAETEREEAQATRTRVAELEAQLRIRAEKTAAVSDLYDSVVDELRRVRKSLGAALERSGAATDVPRFEPRFDPAGLDVPSLEERLTRLAELRRAAAARAAELRSEERSRRRDSVDRWGTIVERLNTLRLDVIASLPDARRKRVLGLGREGVAQLRREVEQLGLSARLYKARRADQLEQFPTQLLDVFAVGTAAWTLLKILVASILFFSLRRRGPRLRNAAYRFMRESFAAPADQRRGELLVRIVEVLAPWGTFLLLVAAVRWALGALALRPELDIPLEIATLYGLYRLTIDVVVAVTLRIVRRYRLTLDEKRTAKILNSVRTMMRVVLGIAVVLVLSEQLLGRGYLYHLVVRFAWIFVLGAAFLLLARWRRPIADAYLGLEKRGRLTALVRLSRDRWYGVFVSAAAFVLLAGRALLHLGRDFAMGFDQTRRALAFMFRRRVEKHAEQRGYADGNIEELPESLVAAFEEQPVSETTAAIGRYPGLDRLQSMLVSWRDDDTGASFLLTGEKGMGKTSWLHAIDPGDVAIHHIVLNHRVLSMSRLVGTVGKELGLSLEPEAGIPTLCKELLTGEKRIVTVDLCQNLFLGTVGGYDTFESFVSLVDTTCERVLWVCSMSRYAWEHLSAVRPDLVVFRDHQALTAWSEEELGKMLRARTKAAGVEVVYDDLLIDAQQARDPSRRLETAERYTRLLWDYSDGNPRVALHYWLRSLVRESDERLRVRLFRAPAVTDLDGLGERGRFLLAAIVVHENLSLQEAADVTRYPKAVCRLQLERLHDQGILRRGLGRYRLTTRWHRAVVRFLKRSNLLSD